MEAIVGIIVIAAIIFLLPKRKRWGGTREHIRKLWRNPFKRSPKTIGNIGENIAEDKIKYSSAGRRHTVLKNIYLPIPGGNYTEIDRILVSDSGVYVFEIKNYKGWIFGDERNQYWTQVLALGYRGKSEKHSFYNPIKQNLTHVHAVERIIGKSFPIHSLVVFSDSAVFKSLTYTPASVACIHMRDIKKALRTIHAKNAGRITPEEERMIEDKLKRISDNADRSKHDAYVKNRKNRDE